MKKYRVLIIQLVIARNIYLYTGDIGYVFGKLIDILKNKQIINDLNFRPASKGNYEQFQKIYIPNKMGLILSIMYKN
jgi:hypothetical protein